MASRTSASADDLKADAVEQHRGPAARQIHWGAANLFGGYEYFRNANPSDDYPNGFETIGGYNVPGNIIGNKKFPTVWITTNAYNINRTYNVFWGGAKYAMNDTFDLIGAIYYAQQNNFSTTPCTGTGVHTSSAACAGTFDAFAFMIDYRPVKRVDLYAGVALSNVYRGLANGFLQTQNIDPTVGLRIKFWNGWRDTASQANETTGEQHRQIAAILVATGRIQPPRRC